jgi:hypothetical protein
MPWVGRAQRAQLPPEERFFWAVLISAALSVSVVILLAIAGYYTLPRLLLINGGIAGATALLGRRHLLYANTARPPGWSALLAAGVVGVGVWLSIPPAEYVIGGRDPGVYFNEGIRIAQRGTLIVEDPVVLAVPPAARDLFFPSHRSRFYYGLRFMGFFILNPDEGAVSSQFPQLFPASIAIGYGLDGLTGARYAPVFWGALGLLALFVTGTRLLGPVPAAAGTLLLALNVAQIWFARYPASEIMMQPLLLAALLAYTRAHADGDRFFGPVAGSLLGMLLLFRVEAVLVIIAVLLTAGLDYVQGRRPRAGFLLPLTVSVAVAAWYLKTMLRSYVGYPYSVITSLPLVQVGAMIGTGLVVLLFLVAAARSPAMARAVRRFVPAALIAAVVAGAVYAYFLRMPGGRLAEGDAMALRTFAWYYASSPALAAAVFGYAVVVRKRFWHDPALLLTGTIFAFFLFYKLRIVPEHFWLARRFLPLLLPTTLLLAAGGALVTLVEPHGRPALSARRWPWVAVACGTLLLFYIGTLQAARSRPILRHVEYGGVVGQLESLAGTIRDDDLLLVEARNASDVHVLGTPLAFIYAKNVLLLASPLPDKKRLADFLADARGRYGRVMFLGGGDTDILSNSIAVTPVEQRVFSIPEYAQVRNAYPDSVRFKEFRFGVYQFVDPPPPRKGFVLNIGRDDDLYVLRMHHAELVDGHTYRWTTASSFVTVLGITPETRTLKLWMNRGGRPASLGPVRPEIYLGDRLIGAVTLKPTMTQYSFEIPPEVASDVARGDGSVRLRIASSTWVPAAVIDSSDARDLGVILARVEVS